VSGAVPGHGRVKNARIPESARSNAIQSGCTDMNATTTTTPVAEDQGG